MFIQEPFNLTGGVAAEPGYEVDYSCRFNSADSSYLIKTSGDAGTPKTWTIFMYCKRGIIGTLQQLMTVDNGSDTNTVMFQFNTDDELRVYLLDTSTALTIDWKSTRVFRDPNAWYFFTFTMNTVPSTPIFKVWNWNTEITAWDKSTADSLAQDDVFEIGTAGARYEIGDFENGTGRFLDGYLAQCGYMDGTVVTSPSDGSLIELDSNGVYRPLNVSGLDFGTAGHFLDFADDSDLGNDVSGNNNDFTSSGLADVDQMTDTPTNNFCIMPSIDLFNSCTTANGNLDVTFGDNNGIFFAGMAIPATGKYYYEMNVGGGGSDALGIGVSVQFNGGNTHAALTLGAMPNGLGAAVRCDNGNKYIDGTSSSYGGAAILNNSIVGVAIDADNGTIWFSDDNTWLNSATKSEVEAGTTTNAAETGRDYGAALYTPTVWITATGNPTIICNFGQSAFTSDQPSGYSALCTTNLAVPTIADPSAHFQSNARTGDGSAGAVTQTGNSQFGTDLIIIKNMDQTDEWKVVDTGRGATYEINTDAATAQTQDSNGVTAFSATDGYTIGTGAGGYNDNTEDFMDYHFQEGSTPGMGINASVSHTQGSETEIAHGMGLVPAFAMLKETDAATSWWVFHQDLTSKTANYLILDTAVTQQSITDVWGTQTSTNFVIGDAAGGLASGTYVCYSFAEVAGFSTFGSYTGNGNADGPLISLTHNIGGLLVKKMNNASNNWTMMSPEQNPIGNPAVNHLRMDTDDVAQASGDSQDVDLLSNGFKIRNGANQLNTSGSTYVFAAWAKNPFGGHGGTFGTGVAPATAR